MALCFLASECTESAFALTSKFTESTRPFMTPKSGWETRGLSSRAARRIIELFLTGLGAVSNQPASGNRHRAIHFHKQLYTSRRASDANRQLSALLVGAWIRGTLSINTCLQRDTWDGRAGIARDRRRHFQHRDPCSSVATIGRRVRATISAQTYGTFCVSSNATLTFAALPGATSIGSGVGG